MFETCQIQNQIQQLTIVKLKIRILKIEKVYHRTFER